MEIKWHNLEDEPIPEDYDGCIILYPIIVDCGILYECSNPVYARKHALEDGYTKWYPIPLVGDEDIQKGIRDKIGEND